MMRISALAACLLLAALLPEAVLAGRPAVSPRAASELAARPDAPIVLDVRTAEEFAAGHVPGAVLIPYDELPSRLGELDRSRWVLVYCRSGRRSGIAEQALVDAGFEVRQIDGSWQRWQAEGLPVETPSPQEKKP